MARSTLAGTALAIAAVAISLSVLALQTPARPKLVSLPAPATIDVSLLITGRGAIGGRAVDHLYNPQLMVARRGDTVRLRVMNQTLFRHGIEIAGTRVRTAGLAGGASQVLAFTPRASGVFEYRCYLPYDPATATCAPDHDKMIGHLVVIDGENR